MLQEKKSLTTRLGQDFKDLDRGWIAAYLQGDEELFDRTWTDGFIFTSPFGQFTNKQQELADIWSGDLRFESLSTGNVTVKVYGSTAVMTGCFLMKGYYKGRDLGGDYDYTTLLTKRQRSSWQIVAS